jgi:hypothetical protein
VAIPLFPVRLTNEVVKQVTSGLASLDESDLLSDLFKDPAKRALHVVIKIPPIGECVAADLTGKMTYVASTPTAVDVVRCPLVTHFLRFWFHSTFISLLAILMRLLRVFCVAFSNSPRFRFRLTYHLTAAF